MNVSDCIHTINEIDTLVERYRDDASNGRMACLNNVDAMKMFELLYNYKSILLQMQVSNILAGNC